MDPSRWLGATWEFTVDDVVTLYVVATQEEAEALELVYLQLMRDSKSGVVESAGVRRVHA